MSHAGSVEIYGLICPDTGRVRYVGKANDSVKRYKSHMRDSRGPKGHTPVYCWFRKLASEGKRPGMLVLETVAPEGDWRNAERRLIAEHRALGKMLNVADGGDEPHCPTETRAANGARNAKARDPLVWNVRRFMGTEASCLKKHGQTSAAEKMMFAILVFDSLSPKKRRKFAERVSGVSHARI